MQAEAAGIVDSNQNEQDRRISHAFEREGPRLLRFIRKRVADREFAEDILQDVFCEFVQAYRMMKPLEQAGAGMLRVARNRIIDRFRRQRPVESVEGAAENLCSPEPSPEAAYSATVMLQAIEDALDGLPREQREVFLAHEIEGVSFKELSERTGVSVNTVLSRKRYAVMHLRDRLHSIHDEQTRMKGSQNA